MNISLFSVEKVVFGRFVCSPEPAQGTRAVPVDGSVLSLSGIPPVIWGDAIHLHMPCFALEGVQGALDQGEGSEGAEEHLSRSGVGHRDPEPRKLTCAAWPECPQLNTGLDKGW